MTTVLDLMTRHDATYQHLLDLTRRDPQHRDLLKTWTRYDRQARELVAIAARQPEDLVFS
jgi:hypothetical protein